MRTILVPIDFSTHSYHSAHFGLELAQQMDARVVLLHVIPPSLYTPAFGMSVAVDTWNPLLHDQMTNALHRYKEELGTYQRQYCLTDVVISTRIVVGQPASAILEETATEDVAFIVMSTVGAANDWDKLVGSVTSAVAQRADQPVWIIPGDVRLDSLRQLAYFADLEGNEVSCINQVLNLGDRLRATLSRATLKVVHVSPLDSEEFAITEALISLFEDTYFSDRITRRHLTEGSVAEGIEAYVRIHQPDAIVLAHRNRGFMEAVFHVSLIRHLSLTTKRPLLIVTKPG